MIGFVVAAMIQSSQAAPGHRPYVQASLFASVRPAARYRILHIDQNLRGATAAIAVGGGAMVSPSIGLEGEFVYGGAISQHQFFNYTLSEDYTAENQQVLIDALLRYRPGGSSPFEFVGGGGYGRTSDRHTSVVLIDQFLRRSAQPDSASNRNAPTLSGGVDFRIRAGSRAVIVPGVRLRWLKGPPEGTYISGAGPWTLEFGMGVRVR